MNIRARQATQRQRPRSRVSAALLTAIALTVAGCTTGDDQAPAPAELDTATSDASDTWLQQTAELRAELAAAEAERVAEAEAAELAREVELRTAAIDTLQDAARLCPPLDTVRDDMRALECWIAVSADDYSDLDLTLPLNFGDLPGWTERDLTSLNETLAAYKAEVEQREAERKAAEEAATQEAERKAAEEAATQEAERKAAEQARRRQQPTQQTLPGDTPCGVRRGEIPTPEQLACIHGTVPPAPEEYDDGYVEWDESMYDPNAPAEHDPDWEPVHGHNPLPPAPSFDECPRGWLYDSDTGYLCL